MDLYCNETVSSGSDERRPTRDNRPRQAIRDPALGHDRVLRHLLRAEERHSLGATSYFETVQDAISPDMRSMLAQWMLEVCEEQKCQEEVFPLAMTYVDRFLSVCRIEKSQLQLLGTACLLLSSKLREPSVRGLPVEVLVFYTDYSITVQELCRWELLVLAKLKWDMAAITPQDFLELLVTRLELRGCADPDMITKHAQTFIALAAQDYYFTSYPPSTMAAASIAAALHGLEWCTRSGVTLQRLFDRLNELTGVEQDYLRTCMERIEQMVQKTIARAEYDPNGMAGPATDSKMMNEKNWSQSQPTMEKHLNKAETPTDVRDVPIHY